MSWATLVAAADVLADAEHAESTKKTRSAQMRAYFRFADEMGLADFPPSAEECRLYAVWLMVSVCSRADSLRQYLSALRVYAARRGHWVPSPTEFGPLLAVVRGAARRFPGPSRRSDPVTPAILTNLLTSRLPDNPTPVQRITLQVLKDTALLLFLTMLRGSNLFPPYPGAACKIRNLTWDKVRRTGDSVIITVLLSKTVQFRQRLHEICLVAVPGSMFCPVAALDRLRDMRGGLAAPDDHVLQLPRADGTWRPLVKYEFNRWFRARVEDMGLDPARFLVHGFRHGSIALAMLKQNNVTLIRLHSNHISEAIFCYSNVDPAKRTAVSAAMIAALDEQALGLA